MATIDDARRLLREVYGFDRFRPGQEGVVGRLLAGRSVLAIFPTGGGKSLGYQLPALLLDGLTVVVSPLIALMKDQIDALARKGVPAARLDSSLEGEGARETYRNLRDGRLKLLYVAPERLANERFLQTLASQRIELLAVDEAHCISEWGHNFRPDYLKLAALARSLKVGRVLALTATATPGVAEDIARAFGIADADVVRTPFHRPNLDLRVTPTTAGARPRLLLDRLRSRPPGATIVYVTQQRTAMEVAALLRNAGIDATPYHAGLDAEVRHAAQDAFMGSADKVIVATIAFGMGIDKADIRYVYHFNLPNSLETTAQEVGRAGRDGLPSTCELLACGDDRTTIENFTYGDTPEPAAVAGLLDALLDRGAEFDASIYELSGTFDIRPLVVETILTYLELEGILKGTGPFYAEYKFQPLRPSAEILARFDAERAAFLRKILARSVKARTWFQIDADAAASALGEPRARIVAALDFLDKEGDITLQVAGLRHGFRKGREADRSALVAALSARFHDHEARSVERVAKVLAYAGAAGCRTRHLLRYFGEDLDADCGHCGGCAGDPVAPPPTGDPRVADDRDRALVDEIRREAIPALATPRPLARFLAGLTSPAASRAKLGRHPAFGALADLPFAAILGLAAVPPGQARAGKRN